MSIVKDSVVAVGIGAVSSGAQINSHNKERQSGASTAAGVGNSVINVGSGILGSMANNSYEFHGFIAYMETSIRLGQLGGALGLLQTGINYADNDGDYSKLTVADILNILGAATMLTPGLQPVGLGITGLALAYAAYEEKYGSVTLEDIGDYWFNPSDLKDYNNINRDGKYHVVDPLALDLDGNGIQTTATAGFSGSLFDHNKDGIRTATGWVAGGDGLLVRDLNGNGIIDNGGELFGDNTILADGTLAQHGYAALAELDENADGKVNALDSAFSSLRIWQDKNQDGISQADELRTLSDLGIESLNTAYSDVNQDLGNGNRVAQLGSYTKTDGSTAEMGDLLLANDNLYSRFTDKIELSAEQFQAAKQKIAERIWRFSYFLIGWMVVKVSGSEFGCVD